MWTNDEKAKEARREIKYREFVYSRRVGEGKMKQQQAEILISIMTEIAEDYERLAEKERLL